MQAWRLAGGHWSEGTRGFESLRYRLYYFANIMTGVMRRHLVDIGPTDIFVAEAKKSQTYSSACKVDKCTEDSNIRLTKISPYRANNRVDVCICL